MGAMSVVEIEQPERADERAELTCQVRFDAETRAGSGRRVSGHAAVFDSPSDPAALPFVETIAPGAFRSALAQPGADILLLWQHDSARPLARRRAGSLTVREDERGLAFDAELADTQPARDALELIRSGIVTQMSFSFIVGRDMWTQRDGVPHRRVLEVKELDEISLVTWPAYTATEAQARAHARAPRRPRRALSPYGPGAQHSFFRDLLTVAEAESQLELSRQLQRQRGGRYEPGELGSVGRDDALHGGLTAAQARLATLEQRALGSTSLDFVPAGAVPGFLADLFAGAARTRAALTGRLRHRPLPRALEVSAARWQTGAVVIVQNGQNIDVQVSTEPAAGKNASPLVTIAGYVDGAEQLFDRATGTDDEAIAAELGAATAAMLEQEIIQAAGQSGHFTGLLSAAQTSTDYTDATPTAAELLPRIGACYADTATAYGAPPDLICMHPRRRAWLDTTLAYAPRYPAEIIESNGIPATLGTASNEDTILVLASGEPLLLTTPPRIELLIDHAGSASLTARVRAYQYVALLAGLQPAALGKIGGTGLTPPSFP
jgi:HK97 family phage prohead protease